MKKIAILVATTAGPVLVERITPEPAPQSMVCLRRQSDVLPISADYDDFVRAGSGVIMREFGPYAEGAFRLDVSETIGTGLSWQLGFFAAHAVFQSSTHSLASLEDCDEIFWLTGTVDYDLNIGDVDHATQKVEASAGVLAEALAQNTPITFGCAPQTAAFLQGQNPPDGITVRGLETTADLLSLLKLGQRPRKKKKAERLDKPRPNNSFWIMAAMAGGAIGALLYANFVPGAMFDKSAELAPLNVYVTSDQGKNPIYEFGDDVSLVVRTNRQAWFYCFYEQVDQTVLQVFPNAEISKVLSFAPNRDHVISGDETSSFVIRLGPPAGEEEIFCYAAAQNLNERLPEDMRGIDIQPLDRTNVANVFAAFSDVEWSYDEMEILLKASGGSK